ncbi:keratin, type I cytoskeletal 18 [Chanos chanos]|uniref:Keratin, type I cytoskeletal 18 n=1 Tax=Chanos chanos TaxID=29144 RepID=A0A6J2UV94_CHACN|nr:keratin, type I cytoskeletal 18-like [Chanos chanos]
MQQQNDRLASYIQKVRNLQEANEKLEEQIREALEKRGPTGIDYSHYDATLAELRDEILAMTKSNAALYLQIDNCNLSAQDFEMKYEQQVHQQVEADIHALRKVLDDTNVERLHLESDIESLNAALITLKKNHNQDVSELQAQIVQSGVKVDVDARKGQDLIKIMEEMRAKYERMALKNQEELKAWHESKITEVDIQVKENTLALKEANRQMTESQRTMNSLEIDLQALISLKASLEGTLNDTKLRYNMEIEKYNTIIHEREATLMELRSSIQQQKQECETLLNSNMKLEAEIATYRGHLDMGHVK